MKNLSFIIIIIMFFVSCKMIGQQKEKDDEMIDTRTVTEKMVDSIVLVDYSSGVVIKTDDNRALILTAYHNVEPKCNYKFCDFNRISIWNTWTLELPDGDFKTFAVEHMIRSVYFDKDIDLAIIEVDSHGVLFASELGNKKDIKYGTKIFSVGNPIGMVKSIKKGIISSPYRKVNKTRVRCFEFDSGTIYGKSGGGVFTEDGKLIGIIQSLRTIESKICVEKGCLDIPITVIGFAVKLHIIEKFIQGSPFCEDFNMCSEQLEKN